MEHNRLPQAMIAVKAGELYKLYNQSELARQTEVPQQRFSQAKAIIVYAPDLADSVISGDTPLSEAYTEAKRRKQAAPARC
jgi:hypothetical protein